MERLTIPFNGGYLFKLPPKDDEKAQEEFFEELSNRLGAYEDAEEQGLLLRLPCKVGEPFYEIINGEIKQVSLCANWRVARYVEEGIFGELAFLTKEEAEQKLESMQKGE